MASVPVSTVGSIAPPADPPASWRIGRDLSARRLDPAEIGMVLELDALVWGRELDEDRRRCFSGYLRPARVLGVFDGARLVAAQAVVPLTLTVPGGATVPMAGSTWKLVHPLYRGRGLMTELVGWLHGEVAREGREPLVGGMPHSGGTHGRYGYGCATRCAEVTVDLGGSRRLRGVEDDLGLEPMPAAVVLGTLAELSGRVGQDRPGWVSRCRHLDAYKYSQAGHAFGTGGPMVFLAHRTAAGEVDGFLAYRLQAGADDRGRPAGTLRIAELLATSAETEARLWQHCVREPMVDSLVAVRRPAEDPVATRLPDPRRWHQDVREDLYLRLVDVPAALAARRYAREDRFVLEVVTAGGARGRYRLEGGLGGASCEPTGAPADVTVTDAALASAYLGDTSLDLLHAGGQAVEHRPGAVRRAGAMFSWSPVPFVPFSV